MTSETSGPNTAAPVADVGVVISQRTFWQVVAFFVAGAIGGGGGSWALSPKEEIQALRASVDVVAMAVNEIRADLRHDAERRAKIDAALSDHEGRLRKLEHSVRVPE